MKIKQLWIITFFFFCLPIYFSYSQSIAEKKASLKTSNSDLDQDTEQFLAKINQETREIQGELHYLYSEALRLYQENASSTEYKDLLEQINYKRHYLQQLEESWREMVVRNNRSDGYGLWHAPETNLEQLIIDYGSQDYVYLIPPDVGSIKLSIDSNLPIPRSAWSEMLELILKENGVGIRPLNPYLRQLYLVKNNNSNLHLITNKPKDLEVLRPEARVSFVLSPEPADVRRTYSFLERFINPQTTTLQNLGRDILLIGPAGELQDLLRLYGFIASNRGEKDYRLLPLSKIRADEMARMLSTIFDQVEAGSGRSVVEMEPKGGIKVENLPDTNGLRIITLQNQALFLVGTKEEIRKAEQIVQNVESQIGGIRDKIVFWYTVKHSDPEELADVLYRVYGLMVATGSGSEPPPGSYSPGGPPPPFGGAGPFSPNSEGPAAAGGSVQNRVVVVDNNRPGPGFPPPIPPQKEPPLLLYGQEGYYQEGGYVVNPAPAQPRIFASDNPNNNRDNFIVDPKTGAIVMVVEADLLPKIKDLTRKLDIKKKMVQIETLLFEKILTRENSFGLNLLKIGDAATNKHATGAVFNNLFPGGAGAIPILANSGVFEFFVSRKKTDSGIPAFDLVYRFLLSQDDVQINTSPSLLTVNQTPATISINEDLSINTGIFEVETAKGVTLKDAFTRAQYGITISIKPTIHLTQHDEEEEDAYDYVTLETDITFDTIQPGGDPSRPNVTRRHITNQVQVPDGDTVVLGGLRRKMSIDSRESIPFIGELPGLGKLFSINTLRDNSTEMFIFITPHIVKDPKEQLSCLRQELLCLRPGDIPYFLECMEEAHQYEKTRLMEGSMTMLFGRPKDHYYISDCCDTEGIPREYDGR